MTILTWIVHGQGKKDIYRIYISFVFSPIAKNKQCSFSSQLEKRRRKNNLIFYKLSYTAPFEESYKLHPAKGEFQPLFSISLPPFDTIKCHVYKLLLHISIYHVKDQMAYQKSHFHYEVLLGLGGGGIGIFENKSIFLLLPFVAKDCCCRSNKSLQKYFSGFEQEMEL